MPASETLSAVKVHGASAIEGLEPALSSACSEETHGGLVFVADPATDSWDSVEEQLLSAFRLTQESFAAGEPIVYALRQPDLLGQEGAPGAMLASALLSAARALAMEDRRETIAVNALAFDDSTDVAQLASWIAYLLGQRGVTGDLIQLGRSHLGKLLP